jgi:glycosyltransferase involved in cell wall biosynthesis
VEGLGYLFVSKDWRARVLRLLVRPFYRWALSRRGTRPVFLNSEDRDRFAALGLTASSGAAVVPGAGVDPERFSPRPEPGGPPVALFAARMLWDKGVGDLVQAARILKERRAEGRVLLAGSPDPGNPASIPEGQLEAWQREGVVEWLGRREDMPDLLARAHVVVLPSYGEGFPRGLLEGAAAGRALIGADTPGCREIVIDGITGTLVPPGEPEALADEIEALWRNPEMRRKMGEQGRELVLARFTEDKVNKMILGIYDELLRREA